MPDLSTPPKSPITVESLLRLKRSEKPSEEFWAKFDRELHARTLQTLMRPQPWYKRLSLARLSYVLAPVGAAAAVALVLIANLQPQQSSINLTATRETPAPVVIDLEPEITPVTQTVLDETYLAVVDAPQFVMDEITTEHEAGRYRKVMVSETYRTNNRGSIYVADPYTRVSPVTTVATASVAHF